MSLVNPKDLLAASDGLSKFGGINGAKLLMHFLRLNKLNKIYDTLDTSNHLNFINSLLDALHVKFEINEEDLKNIPQEGAFVVVANHPLGGIDGVLLIKILSEIRPDFKVMANFILKKIPPISDFILAVNPFETRPDIKSTAGLKQAIRHLQENSPLGIFPAGEVASFQKGFHISDKKWSSSTLRFIKKAKVPVVPIYFDGNNSLSFHLLGKIHPMLRTLKLPSELFNKKNKTIKIRIGRPISVEEQNCFSDIEQYGRYLRASTFSLSNTLNKKDLSKEKKAVKQQKIIPAVKPELIKKEIKNLPEECLLCENKNYQIYCTCSSQIPNTLREIGRLRELTFREVGEGTNQSIDLDEYDNYYNHLFIWDAETDRIVGAYRIGKGKEIMKQHGGVRGFYLKSLFKMKKGFYPILEESLELGRSFIVSDYQRKPLPLFLLWKGILYMIIKNPEYRYLIGPVSISNDYSDLSKEVIIKFIMKNHFDYTLSKCVKPRHKFKFKTKNVDIDIMIETARQDINKLDKYIGKFETKEVRLPVLLKKYISVNAKIIGFNRDLLFNDCLDGFIVLDIHKVPDKLIKTLSEEIQEEELKERLEK